MSGASEATLQELLAVNQQMASAISKMAASSSGGGGGGGGGGPGGPAGKAAGALGSAFNMAGKAVGVTTGLLGKMLGPAISAVSAGFGALQQTGSALLSNQMQLAEGAIKGTNSLASLTAGLEQLPGILGLAMKAYNYQIKKLEANVQTYQQISDVGARFGGNLDQVRRSAASTYLSMDEFASMMKTAGPQLRFMGGSAEEGAKNLVKFNSTMIKGEVGKGLLGMGYTLEQTNGMLASYSEAIGGLKASQLKDQREMEKSVKFFAEELDAAAQLEGKTREQKEKEMKEAAQQAAVRAKLAEMGPEEQKKYLAAYNAALRIGGKGAAEALQSQLLGLPPMTKAAQQFTAVNGEAAQTVAKLGDTITDGTDAATARAKQDRLAAQGVVQSAETYKKLGVTGAALSMKNAEMASTVNAAAKNYADNMNQGIKTEEDALKRIETVRAEQETAQKSQVGAIVQQQGAAKHFGGLMDQIYNALKPLIPYILKLNDAFLKFLPIAAQFAADVIAKGVKFLEEIFAGVDWGVIKQSFMSAWNTLTDTFGGIFEAIKGSFGGGAGIGKMLQSAFTDVMGAVKGITEAVGFIVKKFIESPLFETLKNVFGSLWEMTKELIGAVVAIVKSPVGEFVIDTILTVFDLLFSTVGALIDGVTGAIKWIKDVITSVEVDFTGAWTRIKDSIKEMISSVWGWFKALPGKIADFFGAGDVMTKIFDAIKGIISSLVDGIKAIGSKIVNFFSSKKEEAPAVPNAPTANAPAAPNQPMTADAQARAAPSANAANANVPAPVQPKSSDPIEILRAEIATLNNLTAEMLRAIRDTRDYSRSTANTLASAGNLFKRG